MPKCSFGKISTKGVFAPVYPYGTDLYGRFFYAETAGQKTLLAAFDFLGTLPREANRFRREVSAETGIPENAIWYHELQIHAAPREIIIAGAAMDELIARTVAEVRGMMVRAEEFTCTVTEADFGTKYTMNREQYVAGLGGVTIWTGMSFDEQQRAYSQNPNIMLLRGYQPKLPVFDKPIYFDNPVDPKAYLFVFRNAAGRVIGSLSRFAAHPDVAVLFELRGVTDQYHYDFDWPGYLSERLEREFDAPSMYLNGPCADLSTKKGYDGMDTYESNAAEARRIGETIAEALLADPHRVPMENAENCKAETISFMLPMREDFLAGRCDYEGWEQRVGQAEQALRAAIDGGRPAYEVKQLIDDRYRVQMERSVSEEICQFSEETLRTRQVPATVSALRLGDYLFLGVPGESLVELTWWLRQHFTGAKTIPVDQVNGYYSYVATPRSLTLGGYTYWASWVRRDAVPVMEAEIAAQLDNF